MQVQLNTVLRTKLDEPLEPGKWPIFVITGGGLNIYTSNQETTPVNQSEMVRYNEDLFEDGPRGLRSTDKWVYFETVSGNPDVYEENILPIPEP